MLQVWLPLNGNLDNQGLSDFTFNNSGAVIDNNGKIGKCYSLDGSSSLLYSVHDKTIWNHKPITIAVWFKCDQNRSSGIIVDIAADMTLGYYYNSNGIQFYYWRAWLNGSTRTGDTYADSTYYDATKWHHAVYVADGPMNYIYVDGQLSKYWDSSSKYTDNFIPLLGASYNRITIGTSAGNPNNRANGLVNDIRIYDHALSPREIKEISKGLVLHYPLSMPGNENLITKLYSGGRTTVDGRTITALLSQNLDTYFSISCSEILVNGEDYTLSLYCSGFPSSDNYLPFGIIAQNSGKTITLKNGFCYATFSPDSDIVANTKIIIDDNNRANCGFQDIMITNIKLEKGSIATPWLPNPADTVYSSAGFDDGIEYDVSGYQHNGTKVGTITYDADTPRYIMSAKFDGSSYISRVSPTNQIRTVSFWINTPKTSSTIAFADLKSKLGFGFNAGGYIMPNCNDNYVNEINMYDTSGITANEWCHIALVRDDAFSDVQLYINGVLQTARSNKNYITHRTDTLMIGKRSTGSGMTCLMSDFRAYATQLSEDDIFQLYNAPISLSNTGSLLTQGEYVEV